MAGRFVEISGVGVSATLTAAFGLVLEAQRSGEPVAWITLPASTFFPPDAAEGGVDLDSLAVVRVPDPYAAARSATQLTRSGGFGLIVLDLVNNAGGVAKPARANVDEERSRGVQYVSIPAPLLTRLVGLAQKHATALVVLTEKPAHASSLGSLVSLRAEALLRDNYQVRLSVLKDKRRGPGAVHQEACRGPAGMC
jgi:recombination protein RecA